MAHDPKMQLHHCLLGHMYQPLANNNDCSHFHPGEWAINLLQGVFQPLGDSNTWSIQVLSGFGTFYGPISGILAADFWIVRKRLIKMRDLYIGNEESIYWYYKG